MLLLLIRHADAGARDPSRWPEDALRPLTDTGRKRHQRVARRLRRRGLVPALTLSSPWRRAWETAELTAVVTRSPAPVACDDLARSPDLDALQAAAGDDGSDRVVALVGHDPWISELAALLLTGSATGLSVDFPKSGVMAIATDAIAAGEGTLEFFWRPKGS